MNVTQINEAEFQNVRMETLADKSGAVDVRRGRETFKVNPETGTDGGWPVAGIIPDSRIHLGGWPNKIKVTATRIQKWEDRGLIEIQGRGLAVSPAGPKDNPWKGAAGTRKNHEFVTGTHILFRGDVKDPTDDVLYKIVRGPGKYYEKDGVRCTQETVDRYEEPCITCWDFLLEKVNK